MSDILDDYSANDQEFIINSGIYMLNKAKDYNTIEIDYDKESIDSIVEKIEYAIEQHPSFLKVLSEKELLDLEKSNKQREW